MSVILTELSQFPLVTVVLTSFNSESTLSRVAEALFQQNYPTSVVELIFVDGGSKDSTLEKIRGFIDLYKNVFFSVRLIVHDRNYGISTARNDGMFGARGEYVLVLDSDVLLPEGALKEMVRCINVLPKVGAVNTIVHTTLPVNKRLLKWESCLRKDVLTEKSGVSEAVLLRRSVIETVGGYDTTLGPPFLIGEDEEYAYRIQKAGYKIWCIGWLIATNMNAEHDHVDPKKAYVGGIKRLLKYVRHFITYDGRWRRIALRKASVNEKLRWFSYSVVPIMFVLSIGLFIFSFWGLYAMLLTLILVFLQYVDYAFRYKHTKCGKHILLIYCFFVLISRYMKGLGLLISTIKVHSHKHLMETKK